MKSALKVKAELYSDKGVKNQDFASFAAANESFTAAKMIQNARLFGFAAAKKYPSLQQNNGKQKMPYFLLFLLGKFWRLILLQLSPYILGLYIGHLRANLGEPSLFSFITDISFKFS